MSIDRRRKWIIHASLALPVALVGGWLCKSLLDEAEDAEAPPAVAVLQAPPPAPSPAASRLPATPLAARAGAPAPAPPPEVMPSYPPVTMSLEEWREKSEARQAYEQLEQARRRLAAEAAARPAWMPVEVYDLSRELQRLDRLAAQQELARRFQTAKVGTLEFGHLYQVDYQLDLQAWKLHQGQVQPDPSWAGQPAQPVRDLHPDAVAAYAQMHRRG
ncbi:MAG: hypothetical protein AB7N76_24585 [Planctomycetota bacterium]